MKKSILILGLLVAAGIPLMAADVTVSGVVDPTYMMVTPEDDNDNEADQSYFGLVESSVSVKAEIDKGLVGLVKLQLMEPQSNGIKSGNFLYGFGLAFVQLEELWVAKADAFGQKGLGFKFGKMEVPHNLDYDTGVTHTLSNLLEIDYTWGLNVSYALPGENFGTVNLTTFEGMGGLDTTETPPDDEDTGLFNSLALQWDTGEDAFGVAGLRLVVAYAMIASDEDQDDGSNISVGATYTLKDLGLCVGLEVDMINDVYLPTDVVIDGHPGLDLGSEGAMLIALNVDYTIQDKYGVGLSYEQLSVDEDTDAGLNEETLTRLAVRGSYKVNDNTTLRLEYASVTSDDDKTAVDASTADKEVGGTVISVGVLATF